MAQGESLLDDNDLAWMANLDWSYYRGKSLGFVADHVPIAQAVRDLAEMAVEYWPDDIEDYLACAGKEPQGDWRPASLAFDENGRPTSVYHDGISLVRKHAAWMHIPLAIEDPITVEQWQQVEDEGLFPWEEGDSARRLWVELAPMFARLAHQGDLGTFVAPRGGGKETPLSRDVWRIDPDAAIIRLAKCGLSPDNPFDMDLHSVPTHMLFVDSTGLDKKLQGAARSNFIKTLNLENDDRLLREIDEKKVPLTMLVRHLSSLMTEERYSWSNSRFIGALEERFSTNISGRLYQRIKNMALQTKDQQIVDEFVRRGPRRAD